MPTYRFDHIHLASSAPLGTAEFYERMFGATIESVTERHFGGAMVSLMLHGINLRVTPDVPITPRSVDSRPIETLTYPEYGLNHFALETDDIEATAKELKAKGFQGDEIRGGPGIKLCRFWVPDNILIEFIEHS
ncbi:VOC family protein [Chloroflexota bacterium]